MKSSVGIAVFFWTAIGFPTHGVSQTTYAVGVGKDLCGTYLNHVGAASARSVGRTGPDDGLDYYSKSATDLEWLLGFVTGYNAAASDPEKQFQLDPAAVDLYVRKWCALNPTSNIFTAVRKLLDRTDP
jgi:hypothetical protein